MRLLHQVGPSGQFPASKYTLPNNESNDAASLVGDVGPLVVVRIERRAHVARYVVDICDRQARICLRGDPRPVEVEDALLLTEGESAAEAWLTHARLPLKRRPLFPVRRHPRPSRVDSNAERNQRQGDIAA